VTAPQSQIDQRCSSLKQQIGVLGALALVTLLLAAGLGVLILRQTESAQVADAERLMDRTVDQLTLRYDYLRSSFEERQAAHPLRPENDQLLRSLTEATLAGAPGIEGGFYSKERDRLLGYAYPTYPGSGPKTDIPAAEQVTIQRVAAAAVALKGRAEERVAAGSDFILFRAHALLEQGQPMGAAWVMYRLTGIRNTHQQRSIMGLIGLLVIAVSVAVGAWFLTRRLDRGVTGIESGLRVMEERLETPVPVSGILELDRIGAAINRLASTLLDNQARGAELERRLRQADRLAALGRLVAGVAHELRNPLASVKLKLQLARRGTSNPNRLSESFDVMEAEVGRMDRLVERLLSLAKPSQPTFVSTDLSSFLAVRIELWKARASQQGPIVEFHSDHAGSEPVSLDRDRLGQILDNLTANALDAVQKPGGMMVVEVEHTQPKGTVIAVTDNGPGVPSDAAEHMFEPFFTTRNGGTGLGLFLSAELARSLGGEIRYRNHPGGGARFEVWLPC
jgi:signal transduction histidine kinase